MTNTKTEVVGYLTEDEAWVFHSSDLEYITWKIIVYLDQFDCFSIDSTGEALYEGTYNTWEEAYEYVSSL